MSARYFVSMKDGTTAIVTDPTGWDYVNLVDEAPTVETQRAGLNLDYQWRKMNRQIWMFKRWLYDLSPHLPGVMDEVGQKPNPVTPEALDKMHLEAWQLFDDVVKSCEGTNAEKWALMGKTPLLAFYFGFAKRELTELEQVAAETEMLTGQKAAPDPRVRPVLEPGTGNSWPSAAGLAAELGYALGTVYNHLASQRPRTVAGRSFIYDPAHDPDAPLPGSFNAMTDAERAQLRQQTIDAGFKPRF